MSPLRLPAGSHVGRYEVIRTIGGGGGGTVYEALDPALLRHVAVKLLHVRPVEAEQRARTEARFLREARIACHVRHPHVVDVYDTGVHDGVPYIVMELVDGESLAQLLARESKLSLARTTELLLPILSAVAELHASGVVHRDVKPANVLLPRGGALDAKLADFGICGLTGGAAELTLPGGIVGTLEYMAPELLSSDLSANEKSDQYALGVLLYECVTGRKPFAGPTLYALMHAAVTSQPLAPSAHRPELPGAFDEVILRAIDRRADARYDSIDDLARALLPFAAPAIRSRWSSEFDECGSSGDPIEPIADAVAVAAPHASGATLRDDAGAARPTASPSVVPAQLPTSLLGPVIRPSVLVVDDDALNLTTFRRSFRLDFEITCASSGIEALAILGHASFDVTLVDYAMPGMNGIAFLKAVRAMGVALPAVMVTAHADLPEVRGALVEGWVQAIIMKPFDREAILRWVMQSHRMATMRKSVGLMNSNVRESQRP